MVATFRPHVVSIKLTQSYFGKLHLILCSGGARMKQMGGGQVEGKGMFWGGAILF